MKIRPRLFIDDYGALLVCIRSYECGECGECLESAAPSSIGSCWAYILIRDIRYICKSEFDDCVNVSWVGFNECYFDECIECIDGSHPTWDIRYIRYKVHNMWFNTFIHLSVSNVLNRLLSLQCTCGEYSWADLRYSIHSIRSHMWMWRMCQINC